MTLSQLWSLFWSLPWQARVAAALALVLLGVGVAAVSLAVGHVAGRWSARRDARRAARQRDTARRDRHMRAVCDAPQTWIDATLQGREIEFAGELDLSGGDLEEADSWTR